MVVCQNQHGNSAAQGIDQKRSYTKYTTDDNESDLEMSSEVQYKTAPVFRPVTAAWRKYHCKKLQHGPPSVRVRRRAKPQLGPPTMTVQIIGDGNCLFRALALELTGSQENHAFVRRTLVNFMIEDSVASHVTNYCGTDVNTYLHIINMAQLGVWGTDVEIVVAATLFQSEIWVYTPAPSSEDAKVKGYHWLCYPPLTHTNLKGYGRVRSQAIYLQNPGNHFTVVEDVG